jgi:hypothetical protein
MWKPALTAPLRAVSRWHLTSQYGARRNALIACTALAQRRRERDDVEQFLSDRRRLPSPLPDDSAGQRQIPG